MNLLKHIFSGTKSLMKMIRNCIHLGKRKNERLFCLLVLVKITEFPYLCNILKPDSLCLQLVIVNSKKMNSDDIFGGELISEVEFS